MKRSVVLVTALLSAIMVVSRRIGIPGSISAHGRQPIRWSEIPCRPVGILV